MTVQTTADSSDRREVLIRDNDLIRAVYSGTVTDSKILLQAMYDYQHSRSREPVIKYTTEEIAKLIGVKGTEKIYSILHAAVSRLLDHKVIITCESGKRKSFVLRISYSLNAKFLERLSPPKSRTVFMSTAV